MAVFGAVRVSHTGYHHGLVLCKSGGVGVCTVWCIGLERLR